jgi:hypothetical protein
MAQHPVRALQKQLSLQMFARLSLLIAFAALHCIMAMVSVLGADAVTQQGAGPQSNKCLPCSRPAT